MNWLSSICTVTIVLLLGASAAAQSPDDSPKRDELTIPLGQIWAYNMPGTRDITKMTPQGDGDFMAICRALSEPPKVSEAQSSFVVQGIDSTALSAARAVLVDGKPAKTLLPANSELTLVFFSYRFGRYVRLQNVKRRGDIVKIDYQFVPHKTKELTMHFALIPLGKLSPGEKRVDIVQMPLDQPWLDAGWKAVEQSAEQHTVSRSFSFSVEDN